MDKITEAGFAVSWNELARQAVDKTLKQPILLDFPEVTKLVGSVKAIVLNVGVGHHIDDLFANVRTRVAEIVSLAELDPNGAKLMVAEQLVEIVNDLRRRLQFLKDYFDFQVENFKRRLERGDKFALIPSIKFMDAYPQYKTSEGTFKKRIGADFDSNYRGLAPRMGFPMIDDIHDLDDVRAKLITELWRIYNRDNGFEVSNRKYHAGTKLPRHACSVFLQEVFGAGYGSFTAAVDQIILGSVEEAEKTEGIDQIDEAEVMRLLELSLKTGALPEEDKSKLKATSVALESELKTVVGKLSVSVPSENFDRVDYYFNWRQLLIESKYFGKYGVKIYDIWLTREKLEMLTNHRVKEVEGRLKDLFIEGKRVRHMREMPLLFVVSMADFRAVESMDKDELIAYVEGNVLGHKLSPSLHPSGGGMKEVLGVHAIEGITIRPVQSHLVLPCRNKAALDLLVEKARFFREHPQIPLYMRQIIFSMNNTSVVEIKMRIAVFEHAGITPEWYVHFLHVRGVEPRAKAVGMLKKVMEDYKKIMDYHVVLEAKKPIEDPDADIKKVMAMLEEHVGSENLPERVDLGGLNPRVIKRRIDEVLKRGEGVTFGVLDGSTLKKSGRVRDSAKEAVAVERLAEDEKVRSEKDGSGRLMKFIEEKCLTQPPEYLKITPDRIMAIIDEIESRGVPFKSEYWWWLNATKAQRDNQIEHTWHKISKNQRMAELAEIYEFDVADMTDRAIEFDPDRTFEYCKILAQVGHDVSRYWTVMNITTPVSFRDEMIRRLNKKADGSVRVGKPGLSDKEKLWLDRASKIAGLKSIVGEKIEGVPWEFVADELTDVEIGMLIEADALPGVASVLLSGLERFRNKKKLKDVLRRYRFGYADVDYFTATPELTLAVLGRIKYLEKLKIPITKELLYQDVYEFNASLGFGNDEELDGEQARVLIYLENVGCDPVWARKLARSGESLPDFRAKIGYFAGLKLDPDDYGKDAFELADYEDMLDRSLKYCGGIGLRTVVARVRNHYAEIRLRQFLGANWDRGKSVRASSSVILRRCVFLSDGGIPLGDGEIMSKLVTTYSGDSIEYLLVFVKKVYERLDILRFSTGQKEMYVQVLVKAIDVISKMSQSLVAIGILKQAEKNILSGRFDQMILGAIGAQADKFSAADLQYFASEVALKVYRDVVEVMSFPEIPQDRFLSAEEERKFAQLKDDGDKRAFNVLVVKNLKFVYRIASRYIWSGLPIEDLVQEGNIGLMRGVEKFDYRRGNRLLTYAGWWVRQHIHRYVDNNSRNVRLPVHLQDEARQYNRGVAAFSAVNDGKEPTLEQIAKKFGIDLDQAEYLKRTADLVKREESFMDEKLGDDRDAETKGELMGDKDPGYQVVTEALSRRKFLDKLKVRFFVEYGTQKSTEKAWDVLINRFGFTDDGETMTLEEVGEKWSLTRERIRQIEGHVLEFIRERPELMEMLKSLVGTYHS